MHPDRPSATPCTTPKTQGIKGIVAGELRTCAIHKRRDGIDGEPGDRPGALWRSARVLGTSSRREQPPGHSACQCRTAGAALEGPIDRAPSGGGQDRRRGCAAGLARRCRTMATLCSMPPAVPSCGDGCGAAPPPPLVPAAAAARWCAARSAPASPLACRPGGAERPVHGRDAGAHGVGGAHLPPRGRHQLQVRNAQQWIDSRGAGVGTPVGVGG